MHVISKAGGATLGALAGFWFGMAVCFWTGTSEKAIVMSVALTAAMVFAVAELWMISKVRNPSVRRLVSKMEAMFFVLAIAGVIVSLRAMNLL